MSEKITNRTSQCPQGHDVFLHEAEAEAREYYAATSQCPQGHDVFLHT